MPWTPASPCTQPGCPELNPCPDHPKIPWAGSRQRRQALGEAKLSETARAKRHHRIMRKHGAICHVCREPFADEIDHVIPLAEQGPDTDNNLRPIHELPCHKTKTKQEQERGRARRRR